MRVILEAILECGLQFRQQAKAGGGVIVSLAIGIAMLVVGVQNQDACKNDGAKYLVVNGSCCLVLSILGCIGACFPKVPSSKFGGVDVGAVAGGGGGLAGLIILIWGSVTVFGSYAEWTAENAESPNYCPQTPFMFAFVWLIISWCLIPLMCCCLCLPYCLGFLAMAFPNGF